MKKKKIRDQPGDWKYVCQRTGFRVWASEVSLEWNGLHVIDKVSEIRQPQDFAAVISEDQALPFSRPKKAPRFIGTNDVTADDL